VKKPTKSPEELRGKISPRAASYCSQKLEEFSPHVVAFNGRQAYELFAQRKCKYGLQKELLYGAGLCAAADGWAGGQGQAGEMRHFRKLAQLVAKTEKGRDAVPALGRLRR